MTWRLAKSLDVLRKQINKAAPKRSKASDGTVGDAKHASRSSDHNPWVKDGKTGVVTALDITHDPAHGINSEELAEALLASKDSRIKYVLSNRKIFAGAGGQSPWKWRQYSGANPHNKHVHISVKSAKSSYDSDKPWDIDSQSIANRSAPALSLASVFETLPPQAATASEPAPTPNVEPRKKSLVPAFPASHKPETYPAFAKAWNEAPEDADPKTFLVQWRLKAMNYNPGGLDGLWGGLTAGAIAGFNNDRGRKGSPKIDGAFEAELEKAAVEGFTRPIAEERANIAPEQLEEKAPEIKPIKRNMFWTMWGAVSAFFMSIISTVSDYLVKGWDFVVGNKDKLPDDPLSYVGKAFELLGKVPGAVWLVLVAVALALIGLNSRRGVKGIEKSVQTGERP